MQIEIQPGDIVQAGVVISNSEVGRGTLRSSRWFTPDLPQRPRSRRRAMRKDARGPHERRRLDEVTVFRDDTLQAGGQAFFLKVRDVVEAAVSEATFQQIAPRRCAARWASAWKGDPVTIEVVWTRYPSQRGRAVRPAAPPDRR
ncbi:MAG: hypothetical protein IPP44_22200, partial [Ideonella sp.]|nr:hypothetical protein [Ideonella sp.]